MKKLLITVCSAAALCALVIAGVYGAALLLAPEYNNAVGYDYYPEKLKGTYIVGEAAAQGDNVFIFGSSELNTTMIASHPANFFRENNMGFQVCLIGRGSCQSLIHALNVAGSAESLKGQKVVLIASPQHFIPGGIEPDMFVANFSPQQFYQILSDDSLDQDIKKRLALRVLQCLERYEQEQAPLSGYESVKWLASSVANDSVLGKLDRALLTPYYALDNLLLDVKDRYDSYQVISDAKAEPAAHVLTSFDWKEYRQSMRELGKNESSNNDFGILNDYYLTNIGSRLSRMEGKDADLSYTESVEYDDLRLLMDVCRAYDLDVMYVSIPLNGPWSDFTGLTGEKRQEYYDKVAALVSEYDVRLVDLTKNEYEAYYLCDVMHIGWMGWVDINEAICEFYNSGD